jgi:hypothetical protein
MLDLPSRPTSLDDCTRFRKADTPIFVDRWFEVCFNAVISICDQLGTRLFHTLHLSDALADGSEGYILNLPPKDIVFPGSILEPGDFDA